MSQSTLSRPPLELWGGIECTINRIGDRYFDQLQRNGHLYRLSDLELFAELGIRTIRYPVQWERIAPDGLENADWSWTDVRLTRLRELGIRPVVGLVHHGSGPHHTSLIDPSFAGELARFAQAVAERYPWIESYTPVNEPLTTARFSGLYGHWYPHGHDNPTFLRALLIQCRAVVLAMQAVRSVNPAAQLVQTEDIAKTFSTPTLAYQAALENERRWLTFDLLCGRITSTHPLWDFLLRYGSAREELAWFEEHPCPPDLLGVNYYLTSERFLDEDMERYPAEFHGGNRQHAYADVEAVRIDGLPVGHYARLAEVWQRYHLPLALTEVHLNGTREEQLRYILEAWNAAERLREEGVDMCAVTSWSLLGAYDWNSLLTRQVNFYESGAFDVRSPRPRATAVARTLRTLSQGGKPDHPVLTLPGWWHRPQRLYHPEQQTQQHQKPAFTGKDSDRRIAICPLLITGATGTLGRAFAHLCELRGLPYKMVTHAEMDIADPEAVFTTLKALTPWAVVNAAGYVRVDEAEGDVEACQRANAQGPAVLAHACNQAGIQLLTFSSDLVFDGTQNLPYVESNAVAPLNVYGRTKAEGEVRVLHACPSALIVRSSAFFGPWDSANFITITLNTLAAKRQVIAVNDQIVSPTYVPDLVHTSLDLLIDGEQGIWHLANRGAITWLDLARQAAELAGLDAAPVEGCSSHAAGLIAPRPPYSVLGSERGMLLPSLDDALARYFHDGVRISQPTNSLSQ